MAGFYPDVPGRRMAWDRDGSRIILINASNAITSEPNIVAVWGNDESESTSIRRSTTFFQSNVRSVVIFPELRDVVGIFVGSGRATTAETSTDTTNGLDGIWVNRGAVANTSMLIPAARTTIAAVSWLGVRAIRLTYNGEVTFHTLHLYGGPSAGGNPDRLAIWHPTLDQEVDGAHFDWGDARQSTSADKTFRVKNLSPTLTATGLTVAPGPSTDTSPSIPSQHLLSLNGVDFAASVAPPDLGPGAISDVITIRRNLGAGAALGLWWAKILAEAASWEVA